MKWISQFLAVLVLLFAAPALATVTSPTVTQTDTANGVTTSFAYNFLIPYQADGVTPAVTVQTVVDGITTTIPSDQYSIIGTGNASGGTITYPLSGSPLANGAQVIVTRSYAYTQPTAVLNTGFYPHTVEQVADSLEYQIQQVNQVANTLATEVGQGPVQSFNSRTGAITLLGSDVSSALKFTPARNDSFVAAADYGVSTANTDNGPALQSIDAAGKIGVLAPGVYNVQTTIAFTHSFTGLKCATGGGSALYSNVAPPYSNGCWLKWTGASGGTIMSIIAPTGSTSDSVLSGNVVSGINFDGNSGNAANGLVVETEVGGEFDHLYAQNFSKSAGVGAAFTWSVVHATPTNFSSDACVSQFNRISNITVFGEVTSSDGILLGGWVNPSINGGGCNFSENTLSDISIITSSGTGIVAQGIDNNLFYNVRATIYPGGTGDGVDLGFTTDGGVGTSYDNMFYGLDAYTFKARGTDVQSGCTLYNGSATSTVCTFGNIIYGLDKANGSPDPSCEYSPNNAQIVWYNTDSSSGSCGGAIMSGAVAIGDSRAIQEYARSHDADAGLTIVNSNADHMVLANQNFASAFTVDVDSTSGSNANLELRPIVGNGSIKISNLSTNGAIIGAWQTYTPATAPTPASGSFASASYVVSQYTRINKTILFEVSFNVGASGIGTATGCVQLGLPVAAASSSFSIANAINGGTGAYGAGLISPSGSTVNVCGFSTPALYANGTIVEVSGAYQAAS